MEWQIILIIIFGSFIILMSTGMPIAFAFLIINLVGVWVYFGGTRGLEQLILSMYTSLVDFNLVCVPLFILMGELMFRSGTAMNIIDALDKWLGRLPGRLGFLSVSAGTMFAALTGASTASTALLGSVLVPDMKKRGYKSEMSIGPIMGSGGLAIMIPPSALAVLVGAIGEISVGKILVAIIAPGLLMAALCAAYIIVRCGLQPSLAPSYEVTPTPLSEKLIATVKYVLPFGIVVFLVVGVMYLGVTTPAEAAATGTMGTVIVTLLYRRLNWEVAKKAVSDTLRITGMIFLIVGGAVAFSQILAYSGAGGALAQLATATPAPPIVVVILMQIVLLIMGCFMSLIAIMMITLPIFVPVIVALGFDPVWFAVIFLINMEVAMITPPYGMNLFVMKGVAPPDTTIGEIIRASMPFIGMHLLAMAFIIAFPVLALWLPSQVTR